MKSGSPSRTTAAHKTQTKTQAWSSLLFHCCHSSFNPSEAPPWDSRPVSGAGVVHDQLLHRPRSVPTALGPAPLITKTLIHRLVSCIAFEVALQWWKNIYNPAQNTLENVMDLMVIMRVVLVLMETTMVSAGIKVQGSLLFVTYTIIQGIIGSEMLVRTGPLNGKCKKEKIKHDNKIKIT